VVGEGKGPSYTPEKKSVVLGGDVREEDGNFSKPKESETGSKLVQGRAETRCVEPESP